MSYHGSRTQIVPKDIPTQKQLLGFSLVTEQKKVRD